MKSRVILLAVLIAAGVVWVTSRANWSLRGLLRPVLGPSVLWTEPATVKSASLSSDEQNNIDIYKTAKDATVYITSTTVRENFWFGAYASRNLGSGFLINDQGFILTNYHVISGSNRIQVKLSDQSQYEAVRLNRDPADDLALIQIKPKKKLPYLSLGDSDRMQVGQKVLAIGNPFGLAGTLTTGIVSSIGRTVQASEQQRIDGMIQTDAAINEGNSGGPLLDSFGNVIGINTAILGGEKGGNLGIGFALPINRAKAMLSDYQAGRSTERPKLGIEGYFVGGDLADALKLPNRGGLLVQRVARGSSAAAAGIRPPREIVYVGNYEVGVGGDFIMAVDGQSVDRQDTLTRMMARKRVGDTLELTVFRDGRTVKVPVKLIQPPGDEF